MGPIITRIREDGGIEIIHTLIVFQFKIGVLFEDMLDSAADKEYVKWLNTAAGEFVKKHKIGQLRRHSYVDFKGEGYICSLTAKLEEKKLSEFYLRWGKPWSP